MNFKMKKELIYKLKKNRLYRLLDIIRQKGMTDLIIYKRDRLHLDDINYRYKLNYQGMLNYLNIDKDKYLSDKKIIEIENIKSLKSKEKIKIAFVVPFLSSWIGDELFEKFATSDYFDTYMLICSFDNGTEETSKYEIPMIIDHCHKKKYKYKIITEKDISWDVTGCPDILFYTSPYLTALPPCIHLKNVPLTTLILYTGYGFYLADIPEMQFNMQIHNVAWKNFSHSLYYSKIAKNVSFIKGDNLEFSGYCKIDKLINQNYKITNKELWKLDDKKHIKIIYAPHHSIGNALPQFGTFDKNYDFFYNYAKNHKETTSWIIKPHPVLRKTAVTEGLFKNVEEYDQYLNKWNNLENARVVTGEYIDYFLTSDCMILDSVSFIAEYLYTKKPILFIKRDSAKFNDFGQEILKKISTIKSNDLNGISDFIDDVIKGIYVNENIKVFFDQYLNYKKINGMFAYDYIYKYILKELKGEKKDGCS